MKNARIKTLFAQLLIAVLVLWSVPVSAFGWRDLRRPRNARDLNGGSMALWLNANADNVSLTSGAVQQWNDVSVIGGTSLNFTANASTNRPAYTAATSGAGAFLTFGPVNPTCLEGNNIVAPSALTLAIRFQLNSVPITANAFRLVTLVQTNTRTFFSVRPQSIVGNNTIGFQGLSSAISTAESGINPTLDTNQHILVITYSGGANSLVGSYTASLDGSGQSVVSSGVTTNVATRLGSIGCIASSTHTYTSLLNGNVKDILVYSAVLGAVDLARLYEMLAAMP